MHPGRFVLDNLEVMAPVPEFLLPLPEPGIENQIPHAVNDKLNSAADEEKPHDVRQAIDAIINRARGLTAKRTAKTRSVQGTSKRRRLPIRNLICLVDRSFRAKIIVPLQNRAISLVRDAVV